MRKAVLVVLLTTALVAAGCGGDDDDAEVDSGSGGDKSVELEADDFYFEPEAIDAEVGDTVTVEVENEGDAAHTFTVDALDIDQQIEPGESAEIEVTVPESGSVDFYCRFHKGKGMKGTIGAAGSGSGSETDDTDEDDGGSPNGY